MLFRKQAEKLKRSVDLSIETDAAIDHFRELFEKQGHRLSRGTVIDVVLNAVLNLRPDQAFYLLGESRSRLQSSKALLDATNSADEIAHAEAESTCQRWENVIELFSVLANGYVRPKPMKKIQMQGRSLIVPDSDDWIVVNPCDAPYSTVATVVEIRNGAEYNMPHFVYFEDGNAPTNVIDRAILAVYPAYRKVLDAKVDIQVDAQGEYVNLDEWANAPTPGYFPAQPNNPTTGNPYGVMIILDKGGK